MTGSDWVGLMLCANAGLCGAGANVIGLIPTAHNSSDLGGNDCALPPPHTYPPD